MLRGASTVHAVSTGLLKRRPSRRVLLLSVLFRQGCCNVALVAKCFNRLGSTRLLWSRHGRTRLFNVPLIGRAAREPLWSVFWVSSIGQR